MKIGIDHTTLLLESGALMKLRKAKGVAVECLAGALWITQENELADEILTPGQTLRLTSQQITLIEALSPSKLVLYAPAGNAHFPAAIRNQEQQRPPTLDRPIGTIKLRKAMRTDPCPPPVLIQWLDVTLTGTRDLSCVPVSATPRAR